MLQGKPLVCVYVCYLSLGRETMLQLISQTFNYFSFNLILGLPWYHIPMCKPVTDVCYSHQSVSLNSSLVLQLKGCVVVKTKEKDRHLIWRLKKNPHWKMAISEARETVPFCKEPRNSCPRGENSTLWLLGHYAIIQENKQEDGVSSGGWENLPVVEPLG